MSDPCPRFSPAWLLLVGVLSCGGPPATETPVPEAPAPEVIAPLPAPPAEQPPARPPVPEPARSWAESTLAEMTLRQKVGQLIMTWVLGDFAPEGSASYERIFGYVQEQEIGGVIMSVGSPIEVAAKLNSLQEASRYPLLVAADLETGAGFRMRGAVQMPGTIELGGATDFPTLMALGAAGDEALAYQMGRITALEARAVGIHVPFAPVLDVNNNPDNPIINVRSFGEDPRRVASMGTAFVRGVQENGAISTGKHFPGHGDTETDSHQALPVIRHDRARLDSVELVPFQAAIDAGMGAIMTAHITVPAINGGNLDAATLSGAVLTDLLRRDMGFDGILFTDAMDMAAISGRLGSGEAAVEAIEAGADVILMPASVSAALDSIVAAVERGRVPESRIDHSVRRLLETKQALGLHENRAVALDDVPRLVGIPEHTEVAAEIARKSITVLKNERDLLPLLGTRTARVMSVTYARPSDVLAGRYFDRRLRQTYPRLTTARVDLDSNAGLYEGLLRQARRSALVIVSTYVTAVSYSGSVAIPEETTDFVNALGEAGIPHIVVSFGNPYLISEFPDVRAYVLAWSGSEASQSAAAGALLGDFDVTGRSPTVIPPFFQIGDGIMIPGKESSRHE